MKLHTDAARAYVLSLTADNAEQGNNWVQRLEDAATKREGGRVFQLIRVGPGNATAAAVAIMLELQARPAESAPSEPSK